MTSRGGEISERDSGGRIWFRNGSRIDIGPVLFHALHFIPFRFSSQFSYNSITLLYITMT